MSSESLRYVPEFPLVSKAKDRDGIRIRIYIKRLKEGLFHRDFLPQRKIEKAKGSP